MVPLSPLDIMEQSLKVLPFIKTLPFLKEVFISPYGIKRRIDNDKVRDWIFEKLWRVGDIMESPYLLK